LTQPWAIDPTKLQAIPELGQFLLARGFKNSPTPPAIAYEELEQEYARLLGVPSPVVEMPFATSWMLFRVCIFFSQCIMDLLTCCYGLQLSVISQGVAARYARRQASSESAFIQQKLFPVFAALARQALEDAGLHVADSPKAKL
jgi:hypothetical protein